MAIPFKALFSNRNDPVVYLNAAGSVIECNDASRGFFLVGDPFFERLSTSEIERTRAAFARACNGQGEVVEATIQARTLVPVEIEFVPVANGNGAFAAIRDLTSLRLTEQMLYNDRDRFRSLFEFSPEPLMLIELDGRIDCVNAMMEDFLRLPSELLVSRHWTSALPGSLLEEANASFDRALGGEVEEFETEIEPEGSAGPLPVRVRHIPLVVHGDVVGISTVMKNISSERMAYDHMHKLAFHDGLTALPNRALFLDRLAQMIANAKRYNRPFSVLFLDLDGFKGVNDHFGHAAGDALLRLFAERYAAILREGDTFARLGGDEFAILQPVVRVPEDAEALAAKLLDAIEPPFVFDDVAHSVGLSIGVAIYPWHGIDEASLLRSADAALYDAKAAGKHRFRIATPI